ncbi:archaeal proteasome endopeptidase complex subunit alpha [Halopiger goleimassiliensis]|uniref:archaeal proteasome endopeptidase complex subunit alpha n=1 Tax=Halopiger goleimassiliensis TaxID=1293048 RepID=UPI0006782D80|nr:archaeal proteasome endopeptidase complex subunit alpha [Halopiger goleimassiliensis]
MQGPQREAYDRTSTIFSPDGRLYQVEYAREAVRRGGPVVGVRATDGVVLAAHRPVQSPLQVSETVEKLHAIDDRVGAATAGHVADGRHLVEEARLAGQRERLRYGERAGVERIATAVGDYVQESTQSGGMRPFGTSLLFGGIDGGDPRLYEVDPSGTPREWRAVAVGGNGEAIRDSLEAEYTQDLETSAATSLALRALDDGLEADIGPDDVAIGTIRTDSDGVNLFDRERRASALGEAGLTGAS